MTPRSNFGGVRGGGGHRQTPNSVFNAAVSFLNGKLVGELMLINGLLQIAPRPISRRAGAGSSRPKGGEAQNLTFWVENMVLATQLGAPFSSTWLG